MNTYRYKARNQRGELLEGTIESPSPQSVAQWMSDTRLFPVSITLQKPEAETPPWLAQLLGENKVRPDEVVMFTRQMASMTKAGLPLMQSIEGMQKAHSNKAFGKILKSVLEDLNRGSNLSKALQRHREVFNDYYLNMIRVGEDAGELDKVFAALLRQLEFDRQMKQRIKAAMRYPGFVMGAMFIAISILTIFVIPVFANVYQSMHLQLPLVTRILVGTSNLAVKYWWMVLCALALGYYGLRTWLATQEGRYAWDKHKLRLPLFGKILTKGAIARFCESFATAYRAGVPIVQVLSLVSKVVDNAFFETRIVQMREGLERGEGLTKLARSSGIFNSTELQMILVGEQTGEVDTMMGQIATMYQEDVNYEVSRLSESIEPILLGFMGLLVGILLLGVFLPLWDLGQLASGKP
ncbi:MAG: type II secretion system F family protein [Limnohabitans sp.]